VKRDVGLPGDRVRIADGKLFINDEHVTLANAEGEIRYTNLPRSMYLHSAEKDFTVPADSYFVLGDNSPESADSRFWGCVPAKNILSRAWFCYYPPSRMRTIK
jgi:signal peptidase I